MVLPVVATMLALLVAPEGNLPGTAPRQIAGSISDTDYPAVAISAEEQGTTGVAIMVGQDGRPKRCTASSSSGSAVLDATACALVMQRFRFSPGRDRNGRTRIETVRRRITWRLPRDEGPVMADGRPEGGSGTPAHQIGGAIAMTDYPRAAIEAGESGTARVLFTIGTDGRAADCIVVESSGSAVLDATSCSIVNTRFRFEAARDGQGQPAVSQTTRRITWVLPETPTLPVIRWEASEMRLSIGIQDGRLICALETTGRAYDSTSAFQCPSHARAPMADILRAQTPTTVVTRLRPEGATAVVGAADVHGRLMGRAAYEIEVDQTGMVSACRPLPTPPPAMPDDMPDLCSLPRLGPGFERSDRPGTRRARIEVETYRLGDGVA